MSEAIKQRILKKLDKGTNVPVYIETVADAVVLGDGTNLETKLGDMDMVLSQSISGKRITFTADQWTGSGTSYTLTIPKSSHGLEADVVFGAARALINGKYIKNVWAALETNVEMDVNKNLILSSTSAFTGDVIVMG